MIIRSLVLPALVTAAAIALLTFGSVAASSVLGVVASMSRYPEAMMDYALPALGNAAENWMLPTFVFGLAAFAGLLVLSRGAGSPGGTVSVPRAVLGGVLIAVISAVIVGVVAVLQVVLGDNSGLRLRELSVLLVSAGQTTGVVFLVGTPILVLGAVLLRYWRGERGLTEPTIAL